jgi:hypothetical protein
LDPITQLLGTLKAAALNWLCAPREGSNLWVSAECCWFGRLRETPNDYFTLVGSRHRGVEDPENERFLLLPVGIGAGASFEMTLVILLALIARTT